jgi:hypothetical protein
LVKPSPMEERLRARDREPRVFKGLVSASTTLQERKVRRPRNMIEPEPNAPLLKRIVKYPYEEVCRGPVRRKTGNSVRTAIVRLEPRKPPMVEGRSAIGDLIVGNPIRGLNIHPVPLASPPSVEEWLASKGDE